MARLKLAYHQLHHAYEAHRDHAPRAEAAREFHADRRVALLGWQGRAAGHLPRPRRSSPSWKPRSCAWSRTSRTQQAIINSLLNRPQDTPVDPPAEMEPGELNVTLDELLAHARTDAPAVMRDQKMVERNELALNLARKDYAPDYVVSGGYYNQGGMPPMYQVRLDVKLPAYFWRKQRAEVDRTDVHRERSPPHLRSRQAEPGGAHSRRVRQRARRRASCMDLYSKSVTPQASLALESSLASYQTGAIDFLSVLTNFMTVVDYELNYHEEMVRFHLALARLEEMTGLEIDPAR